MPPRHAALHTELLDGHSGSTAPPAPGSTAAPAPGSTAPPALALLHGFTQTGRLWGRFGQALEQTRPVVQVDLPGHGGSTEVDAPDLWATADLVVDAINSTVTGTSTFTGTSTVTCTSTVTGAGAPASDSPFDLCGYSLGARVALHVALARPQAVRRLVLISATAGIDDGEARRARRRRDDELADELARSPDVGPFLARWLAAPMFDGLPADAAGLAERRRNTPSGLASSLRHAGTGTQDPLWDRLGELTLPVLLVAGSTDIRFVAAAVRMRARLPHAVVSVIPGAGHAVHLHQPALTARTVVSWLGVTGD